MEHDAKSGHIVLENFNSTANLASNPGFQSTLTLGPKEVINEKAYDPFEHRNVEHPNSSLGSLVHLLKSSLGSGILAMPAAFKNAGLAAGAIGTIVIGFIATHCVYVLVKTSQELCAEVKQPQMGFAETCGAAFQYGPKKTRRFAGFARTFVDYAMASTYFAALCVYVLFIAENFQEVSDVYLPEYNLTVKIYCALTLVPLVLMCQIRNLQWLVPFSAIANVLLVLCFSITMYYLFSDMPDLSSRQMVAPVPQWPLFISTVIFAMEGIGVVMPVENEMSKPQQFLGCPGVLNISMSIVVGLYGLFGFFGYLKYGDAVKGSITLSLPQDEILAQSAKVLMALAILFTYGLQFYVCMEMIWRQTQDKIAVRYHNVSQICIRTAIVVASVIFAIAFPDLELIISLIGAIFLSTLGLLVPAVVDTVHNWERNIGFLYWKVWKNILISFISLLALFVGSYSSVSKMITKFGSGAAAHETVANQTLTGMFNGTIGL